MDPQINQINSLIRHIEALSEELDIANDLIESLLGDSESELNEAVLLEKKKWIQKAIEKEGSLRKTMKTKKGEKIPVSKLKKAAEKGGKTGKRARLALTLRKLNEGGVVGQFNDADDTGNDEKIATQPDGETALWSDESLVHRHYRYPSKELMGLAQTADTLQQEYLSKRAKDRSFEGSPEGRKLGEALHTAKMELYKHPHYTEFRKGHPSKRNRPIISATFHPDAVIDTSREGT